MLVVLSLALPLSSVAFAGDVAGDVAADSNLGAQDVAATHIALAAYGDSGYLGMALVDGMATDDGGATLVVRYHAAGRRDSVWVEGITVDGDGDLVSVVRRVGRRLRTLTVTVDGVQDVVTEGDAPLSSQLLAVDDGLSNPWLLGLGLVVSTPAPGRCWQGSLVDGGVRALAPAVLTCQGSRDVGQGRRSSVAQLVPDAGSTQTFLYDSDGLSAIIRPQSRVQWVAADPAQVQATQDKTLM